MEFRHLVASETSALLSRLLVRRSEQSLRDLAACRKTLDEALLKIETALREGARDHHDHEVPALVERLTTAAGAEAQASIDQARAEAQNEVDLLRAKADTLQAEVRSERERTAAALIELAEARSALTQAQTAARQIEAARRKDMAFLEQASRENENARRDLQAKLDAARETEEVLRERLVDRDHALATAATRIDELPFDRLVAIYQELESGTSIMAVLIAFAKGVLSQFPRVALFSVSDNRLEGVYQSGLDIKNDITDIAMPLTIDSILTQAANSGSIVTLAPNDSTDQSRVPFGGTSGWCLALPVAQNSMTIAVIYADDGNGPRKEPGVHQPRVNFADALRRHAVAVLRALSVDLKAREELQSYATLLLDEVEYVYEADVRAGKQNAELVERLTDVLRCAQESYARRVASAALADIGPDLFQDRLTALIDARATASFGRHLAIASYAIIKADPMASQPAAQA